MRCKCPLMTQSGHRVGGPSVERNTDLRVCAPRHMAPATNSIDDDVERLRKAKRRRNLKGGASVRNVTHRTFELWRLLAKYDESTFQNAATWRTRSFSHRQKPVEPMPKRTREELSIFRISIQGLKYPTRNHGDHARCNNYEPIIFDPHHCSHGSSRESADHTFRLHVLRSFQA